MKIKSLNHKKLNNKGLTLVEVIVAVAILSFAILPLMYTFVYTSRFNAKSREQQRATSAAEAILENYKAYPLTEINSSFGSDSFTVGDAGAMGTDVMYSTDLASTPSKYVIRNMNFEKAGAANTQYDALITVRTHNDDAAYSGTLYELANADNYNDAIYKGQDGLDEAVYNEVRTLIKQKYNDKGDKNPAYTIFDENRIEFKRSLKITITKDASTGKYKVKPELYYTYKVPEFPYVTADGNSLYFNDFDTEQSIDKSSSYPTMEMKDGLDRLFIYYFPMYTMSSGDHWVDGDSIEIYNATGEAVDLYLYKQRSNGRSDSQTYSLEGVDRNSKRTQITIKQGTVNIYHNLFKNIGVNGSGVSMTDNGLTAGNVFKTDGGSYVDKTTVTPTPVPTADILSDISVKIYARGSLDASGNELPNARVLAEINSTFNGK